MFKGIPKISHSNKKKKKKKRKERTKQAEQRKTLGFKQNNTGYAAEVA